ncbi:MAG: hypothetical protein A3I02_09235 [Betaproteobacteria bacterium RIFCSPLOWO2_02_FULL_67_26]|nr:MAG: hypothetical protein A3I02_09235 [Betaproteobacteria bacterium RIFCSPLOWO2_02_FULL_67_26]
MTHAEFAAAYARGEIKVDVDPQGAARFISARLLLPLMQMPVLGIGVALALVGWLFTGLVIIALGIAAPRLIKRSAPHFVFQQALNDPAVYDEVTRAGLLRVTSVTSDG